MEYIVVIVLNFIISKVTTFLPCLEIFCCVVRGGWSFSRKSSIAHSYLLRALLEVFLVVHAVLMQGSFRPWHLIQAPLGLIQWLWFIGHSGLNMHIGRQRGVAVYISVTHGAQSYLSLITPHAWRFLDPKALSSCALSVWDDELLYMSHA